MNIKEAKTIDMVDFLQKIGFTGTVKGTSVLYCSPFRNERTPSFRVDQDTNRFKDFGTGQAGDILDLVKEIYKTDIAGALQILSNSNPDQYLSFSQANSKPIAKEPGININRIQPIQEIGLLSYLSKRKIRLETATSYLQEAHYSVKNYDFEFYSICFKNDKGGYELRNTKYKSCTSPKYYTSFLVPERNELNLFEGFFDALSFLEYNQVKSFSENTIVLNSLSLLDQVIPLLAKYAKINLYLDNDQAGNDAVNKVKSLHPCTVDQAKIIYPSNKDFNEFLINSLNNR
ncbi:MAG: toprim domain-containing protein [Bacteroidota bacterium]